MKKLMVLDGNSIVNRAFYGVSQNLTTRAGQPTNAIFGFLNILDKLVGEESPDALCVTFDRKAPTFRHLAYEGYKATRKGMPDELASQLPLLKDVLAAMNIPMYELDGWEADDLIGTISLKDTAAGWETVIVTGDKDSLQLVTDTTTVKLVSTRMGRTTTRDMTPEVFREEYGFDPIHIIDLKALMGDSSDNIPGVKGVGEKTAMALVQRYGSIDDLYAALPEVEMAPGTPAKPGVIKKLTEGEDQARMSYDLATIHTDAPIDFAPENNLRKEPNGPALYQLFLDLEFAKLIDKFHLTAPQGEGAVREEAAAQVNTASEVVETRERLEELLALWRGLDEVNVLALPSLDVVCVEWAETEKEHRAALLFAGKLECYNDGLRTLFAPDIKKVVHGSKELWKGLLDEGIQPGGIVFDTEVAAYLLAPTDGSYELEKLGMTYFNQEFPKAKDTYLAADAFTPLADQGAVLGALMGHTALIGALKGALAPRLEELGMREDTIVIFTADNGMNMGHHGIWGKGNGTFPFNLFDTAVKVPFIARWPGRIPAGRVTSSMCSHYDIIQTLNELMDLGAQLPEDLPGRSFANVLKRGEDTDNHVVVLDEYGSSRMIRSQEWKYIHRYPYGPHELYHLTQDPGEKENLVDRPEYAQIQAQMLDALQNWYCTYADPAVDGTREGVTGFGQMRRPGIYSEGKPVYADSPKYQK